MRLWLRPVRDDSNKLDLGSLSSEYSPGMVPVELTVLQLNYCAVCSDPMVDMRKGAIYCSGACKQKAWRRHGKG